MSEKPTDIVGHKSFDTGERDPETGMPMMRHEPLTRDEADAMWAAAEASKKRRAETKTPQDVKGLVLLTRLILRRAANLPAKSYIEHTMYARSCGYPRLLARRAHAPF